MGSIPVRPFAEDSDPALAELRRHGQARDAGLGQFSWIEDAITPWSALALVGGLIFAEGLLFSMVVEGGFIFLIIGALLLIVGVPVAAAAGIEYFGAVLGAGALAIGIWCSTVSNGVSTVWAPARFSGLVPVNGSAGLEVALLLGGLIALVAGLARSVPLWIALGRE